jgi:Fur family peroxide stress response transcriptional regulator
MHSDAVQQMLDQVRAAGLKLTPQRIAIVRELADDETHPTAQELFSRLKVDLPTMSFATVYNTLSTLADAGLCSSRSLTDGPTRFDPNTAAHDHAVCDTCGSVVDVSQGRAGGRAPEGFQVRLVERIYRGLCAGCAAASQ